MNFDPCLIANARDAIRLLRTSVWAWAGLAVVLVLMGALVYWVRSRFLEDAGPAEEMDEMLAVARNLHREGSLTEEEYRSIKGRLLEQDDATKASPESTSDPGSSDHSVGGEAVSSHH